MKTDAKDYLEFLTENIESLASSLQPLWHPLGFASCVLKEEKDNLTLRVHYWPPNIRRTKNPDWPIHTHSYTLSSLILKGSIEDIQYVPSTKGDEYSVYQVSYMNGNSEIVRTDSNLMITELSKATRIAGHQYKVERGVFHQSQVPITSSAVTLVALSNFGKEPPLVLGDSSELRYAYDRSPFDQNLFWSVVRDSLTTSIS